MAGDFGTFTVTAKDAFGNVATGYRGTAVFTTNASRATLPGNYAFTAADNGVHTFSAALLTTGSKNITVTDLVTSTIIGKQSGITVVASAPVGVKVLGFPSTIAAGSPGTFTVRIFDANNNTVTGYVGTVVFTSDDPLATLPASYTFKAADAGQATFNATLRSPGKRSITVTDSNNSAITGQQTSITVTT